MIRPIRPLAFAAALLLAAPALAEEVTITFVQTNDIDRMEEKDGRGGFARASRANLVVPPTPAHRDEGTSS